MDELPILVGLSDFEFDETEYPEPPENNYRRIRRSVESKFPSLGFYVTASYEEGSEATGQLLAGDAIDDVTDIVGDLLEIEWYFENTSEANALWHLETDYRTHWASHLRAVQLYLYRQHYS